MRFIINSGVITAHGFYEYQPFTVDQARNWLAEGEWQSNVGYPETAAALTALTGIEIPVNRIVTNMNPGDEALMFRLAFPPGTPRLDPRDKGRLTPEFVTANSEMGWLKSIGPVIHTAQGVRLRDRIRYDRATSLARAELREILTENEISLILDACNGLFMHDEITATSPEVIRFEIEDSIRLDHTDEKWKVDGDEIVHKLAGLTYIQQCALADGIEYFWNRVASGEHALDTLAALAER